MAPIRTPAPIIPLRMVNDNESVLVNDIPSMLTEKDVDYLHDHYQISREIFHIYVPSWSRKNSWRRIFSFIWTHFLLKSSNFTSCQSPNCTSIAGGFWWNSSLFSLTIILSRMQHFYLNCTSWVRERMKSSSFLAGRNARHFSTGYPHP